MQSALPDLDSWLQVCGIPICLGTDAMDIQQRRMVRFVAPVTMLATGGLGQVGLASCTVSRAAFAAPCAICSCSLAREPAPVQQ